MPTEDSKISPTAIRTIVDGNTDVFRYGLFKYDESAFEDPTYLGFTLEIDTDNSALFQWVKPFLEKHSNSRIEHNARLPVYTEFVNKIIQVFKSQESVSDPFEKGIFVKSHYINSISGLDALSKKFIDWKKDSIEIELHEDISMFSSYLAHLYNNLVYSYETGRVMIPENLVKFNLFIKISEVRNLTSLAKLNSNDASEIEIANALKNNVSCIIYKLTDCEFDFTQSRPFGDEIIQGGIGASNVSHSVVPMRIFFKSVSRQTFNPLIKKAVSMKDDELDLSLIIVGYSGDRKTNGQATDPSSGTLNADGSLYQQSQTDVEDSPKASDVAFLNGGNKKPSSIKTYKSEVGRNSDIQEQNDFQGIYADMKDIQEYNRDLAPDPRFVTNTVTDTSMDTNLSGGGFGLTDILSNPQAAIGNFAAAGKAKGLSEISKAKQAGIKKLQQLRAELVNSFVYKLEKKVGIQKIIPNNVNTDPNYFRTLAATTLNGIGINVGNDISSILKG